MTATNSRGVGDLVNVGAAHDLAILLLALAAFAHTLRPAGQVEQAGVVAEGELPVDLSATTFRQADQAGIGGLARAAGDQLALVVRPQARTVIDMSDFVQHRRQQFLADRAVGSMSQGSGRAAVGEAVEELAVEFQAGHGRGFAIRVVRHLAGPVDADAPVQPLDKAGRQARHGFIEQCLAGLALCRAQVIALQVQLQPGDGRAASQQ